MLSIGFYAILIAAPAYAATQNSVKDLKEWGTGVLAAVQLPKNTAGALAALDSNAQIAASAVAGMRAISGATPANTLAGFDAGSRVIAVTAGANVTISNGVISAAGGTGAAISGTPPTNSMAMFATASTVTAATAGVNYAAPSTLSVNIAGYLMPSGTISNAAATITLGTALPEAYTGGV